MKMTLESHDELSGLTCTISCELVTLTAAIEAFESFLLASGFVLKGRIEVVEDDYFESDEKNSEFEQ